MNKIDLSNIKIIEGGICAVEGVKTAGLRKGKYGIALILSEDSDVAGMFTSNKITAAPVNYTKKNIEDGKISLIVANSGNANCFTSKEGIDDCDTTADFTSKLLNISQNKIAIASTGVIGRKMPMDTILPLIEKGCENLENSKKASQNAAKAIMTTDTVFKEFAVEVKLTDGNFVKIGGICKGTGMIAPNMGTMLCFISTDAKMKKDNLKKSLKIAVEDSFNMVVVDGDESTNDTVLLFANGESNNDVVHYSNKGDCIIDENFQKGLNYLCQELAKKMAKDGEGATKFIEVEVMGTHKKKDAQLVAKSIIKSSLVKTAVFGGDPNWGRIVAAIGYSTIDFNPDIISIAISSNEDLVYLIKDGDILAYEDTDELKKAEAIMKNKEIKILVDINQGKKSATAYGCDLSYDYVKINAEYTT